MQLLILTNFDEGYHITLQYPKGQRPKTYEEAEDNLTCALYKISRRLKRQDKVFKYLAVTERGKIAEALHHHMIIEGDPDILAEVMRVWGPHMHISPMYSEGLYKELADYLLKVETKEELTKGKSRYHRSRNLQKPLEKTAIISGALKDEPIIPQGFELIRESVKSGFNEFIGIRWQKYLLREIPKEAAGHQNVPKSVTKENQKCTKRESIWTKLKKKIFGRP